MPSLRLTILALCLPLGLLHGHEEPSEIIHALSHQLETTDPSNKPSLYYQRALEYRALRKHEKAERDLRSVLVLQPSHFQATKKLAQLTTDPAERLALLQKSLKLAKHEQQLAEIHLGLAQHYYQSKDHPQAKQHCEAALRFDQKNDLAPVLFQSHLLFMLGQKEERVLFLEKAQETQPSIVLRHQWIHAMIDTGRQEEVRELIQEEMNSSRFKSSWHIRAALCELKANKGNPQKAKDLALAAIAEIKQRLNLERPDITLLMDLAQCHAITGEHPKTQEFLQKIKQLPHHPWQLDALKKQIDTTLQNRDRLKP